MENVWTVTRMTLETSSRLLGQTPFPSLTQLPWDVYQIHMRSDNKKKKSTQSKQGYPIKYPFMGRHLGCLLALKWNILILYY